MDPRPWLMQISNLTTACTKLRSLYVIIVSCSFINLDFCGRSPSVRMLCMAGVWRMAYQWYTCTMAYGIRNALCTAGHGRRTRRLPPCTGDCEHAAARMRMATSQGEASVHCNFFSKAVVSASGAVYTSARPDGRACRQAGRQAAGACAACGEGTTVGGRDARKGSAACWRWAAQKLVSHLHRLLIRSAVDNSASTKHYVQ